MAKLIVTFLAVAFCVVLLVDDPQSTGYGVRVALTVGTRVLETAATALDELLRSAAA